MDIDEANKLRLAAHETIRKLWEGSEAAALILIRDHVQKALDTPFKQITALTESQEQG